MSQAKGNSPASKGRHLRNSLEYILNPEKTGQGILTGGLHVLPDAETAFKQMLDTKKVMAERHGHDKADGRQGYHFVLSFSPKDNVTAEQAMGITEKFVREYIPDFESVYAVHTDKKHLHSHIVFNSVSMSDGKKYHCKKGEWEKHIQPITNRLCEEYGLSTINLEDFKLKQHRGEGFLEPSDKEDESGDRGQNPKAKREKTKTELIEEDVGECLKKAKSKAQFDAEMRKKGYTVKRKGSRGQDLAHVTVIPPKTGETQPRGHRLRDRQKEIFDQLPEEEPRVEKTQGEKKDTLPETTKPRNGQEMDGNGKEKDRKDEEQEEQGRTKQGRKDRRGQEGEGGEKNSGKRKSQNRAFSPELNAWIRYTVKVRRTRVEIDLAGGYLLKDRHYRKNSRLYREYAKFDLTRKKIKYLHSHSIKTHADLQRRKEELSKAAESIRERKEGLREQRKPHEKAFRCYRKMEELRIPAQLYLDGDATFRAEYEAVRKAAEQIQSMGMTVEEVRERHDSLQRRLSELGRLEHELRGEMDLCEAIGRESGGARSSPSLKQPEHPEDRKKQEKEENRRKARTR